MNRVIIRKSIISESAYVESRVTLYGVYTETAEQIDVERNFSLRDFALVFDETR